jgi:hypothetical protein
MLKGSRLADMAPEIRGCSDTGDPNAGNSLSDHEEKFPETKGNSSVGGADK